MNARLWSSASLNRLSWTRSEKFWNPIEWGAEKPSQLVKERRMASPAG